MHVRPTASHALGSGCQMSVPALRFQSPYRVSEHLASCPKVRYRRTGTWRNRQRSGWLRSYRLPEAASRMRDDDRHWASFMHERRCLLEMSARCMFYCQCP